MCGSGGGASEGESDDEESEELEEESASVGFGERCSEGSLETEIAGVTGGGSCAIASSSESSSGAGSPMTVGTAECSVSGACSLSDETSEMCSPPPVSVGGVRMLLSARRRRSRRRRSRGSRIFHWEVGQTRGGHNLL